MTTPVLAREGARIGGVTTTDVAVACRSDGANATETLSIQIFIDAARTVAAPGITYTNGTLNAGDGWQATAYATGLAPGKKYWWRVNILDAVGGSDNTDGVEPLHAGSFRTIANNPVAWKVGIGGCYYGWHIGFNANYARRLSNTFKNWLSLGLDAIFHIGDIYYPDNGGTNGTAARGTDPNTTSHVENSWFNQDGTTPANDGSLARFRTNFATTLDGNIEDGGVFGSGTTLIQPAYSLAHVMAAIPGYYMWDDHDRCYDDCEDLDESEGALNAFLATKRDQGHQVGHECYMDLNKALVDQESGRDFDTDNRDWATPTPPEEWFYVDKPPVRFVVLDCRSHRDTQAKTDDSTKTMLGATQKAWLKARIDDNTQPFLAILSPVNGDGNHGEGSSDPGPWDGWKGYSFERDEILDYVWNNGSPSRTVIISSDTHNGAILKYDKHGTRMPIYEVQAGNGAWIGGHAYIRGLTEELNVIGDEVPCASGNGASLELMVSEQAAGLGARMAGVVECKGNTMRVSLVEVDSADLGTPYYGKGANKKVWSRLYK